MSAQFSGSVHGVEVIRHLTCGWLRLPAHLGWAWWGPPGLQYRACWCRPAHLGWGMRGPPAQLGCWRSCRACCPSQPSLVACGPSPPLAVCQVAPHSLPEPW
ncbi:hypothetical protein NDU88_002880 [Pleurodeles waltl]|uniref:Uncharacterized protein n=1 Tax=Pleurodeles waltl TaxID=8319 RepID=A0AAV7VCF8_PLEWA|nr:hypothetical protein NDU88_002880 [Pleurodeles waltl]